MNRKDNFKIMGEKMNPGSKIQKTVSRYKIQNLVNDLVGD
jgi:hypothetical protein